jgi:Sigma-70, region 4
MMMIDTTDPDLLEAGARAAHNYWDQCFLTSDDGQIECDLDPWRVMMQDALAAMARQALLPRRRKSPAKAVLRQSRASEYANALIAGATLEQIAAREGVSRERIRQIVRDAGLEGKVQEARAERRIVKAQAKQAARASRIVERKMTVMPPDNHGPKRIWTDEKIIDAVREWLAVGGSGKVPDWIAEKRVPSASIVVNRIGWSDAIRAAGGVTGGLREVRRKDYRSREECLRAVVMFLSDPRQLSGSPAAYDDWARHRGAPGSQTVRHRFGSWTAGKQAAIDVINTAAQVAS